MEKDFRNTDRKLGWTEKGIIGWIFTPMGVFFPLLGLAPILFGGMETGQDRVIFLSVFGGTGLAFLIAGLALLGADIRRRRRMRRALDGGEYVMAKIAGVQQRMNVNMHNTHPYVVECHYTDPGTGEVHVWYSRYLYFNPADMLTSDTVPVYIDRMDEKAYCVDVDAVLPNVVLHGA